VGQRKEDEFRLNCQLSCIQRNTREIEEFRKAWEYRADGLVCMRLGSEADNLGTRVLQEQSE
jgi:hypothetical protein